MNNTTQYTKIYPNTKSTLTIIYPVGLFSDIVDNPRTLYRVSQEGELYYTPYDFDDQGNKIYKTDKDYGRQAYPDLILIPANGSFIYEHADKDEITTFRRFRKNDNGVWEKIDERIDETHEKVDEGDQYSISIYGDDQIWFRGSPNTLIDNRCYSCGEISIRESMEENDIDNCVPSDLSKKYVYDTIEKHITITIYGEVNFFESNATHYFCAGTSENSGTLYCNSYFPKRNSVGSMWIIDSPSRYTIEVRPISLTHREQNPETFLDLNNNEKQLIFSDCHLYYDYDGVIPSYVPASVPFNTYSRTKTYNIGDGVEYKRKAYRCTTAIPNGETWDPSHWSEVFPPYTLSDQDIDCDGFRFRTSLSTFWLSGRDVPQVQTDQLMTYRNKEIKFIWGPMVAISTLYTDMGASIYTLSLEKSNQALNNNSFDKAVINREFIDYSNPPHGFMAFWEDSSLYGSNPINKFNIYKEYQLNRYSLNPTYVFAAWIDFFTNGNELEYTMISPQQNNLKFSGYFTTESYLTTNSDVPEFSTSNTYKIGDVVKYKVGYVQPYKKYVCNSNILEPGQWDASQWIEVEVLSDKLIAPWRKNVSKEEFGMPIYEYGTVLYPVFYKNPQCIYIKLNTDKATDEKGILGNQTANNNLILSALKDAYGENFIYKNVDNWSKTSVCQELLLLKNSPCKFKILYINCHGGKYKATDKTFAILSEPENEFFTFDQLTYLLKNKRPDEYYFIYLANCFAGGLLESYVHNDVNNQNYTIVDESDELGTNYLIWFADCANSPSWGKSGGSGVCDLFKIINGDSYQSQANHINQIVHECRSKNVQLLADFLQNHYEFMRDVMFVSEKLNWTQETYEQSLANASNLIIRISREVETMPKDPNNKNSEEIYRIEYLNLLKKYPIMMLYAILFNLDDEKLLIHDPPQEKSEFIYFLSRYTKAFRRQMNEMGIEINHKDEDSLFKYENITKTYKSEEETETKHLLLQYLDFFYDLYLCWNQMSINSNSIRQLNNYPANVVTTYLLDDIPGVVFKGDQQFGECTFPKYPGYQNGSKISQNLIDEILYDRIEDKQ